MYPNRRTQKGAAVCYDYRMSHELPREPRRYEMNVDDVLDFRRLALHHNAKRFHQELAIKQNSYVIAIRTKLSCDDAGVIDLLDRSPVWRALRHGDIPYIELHAYLTPTERELLEEVEEDVENFIRGYDEAPT